jgi:hypothetical protein
MNYLVCIIILLIILSLYLSITETFTTYQINYRTDITPWSDSKIPEYRRCICSSSGKCNCIKDSQIDNEYLYSEFIFH